jgi:hypothetical protein
VEEEVAVDGVVAVVEAAAGADEAIARRIPMKPHRTRSFAMISNAKAAVRVTGHRLRASLALAAALCLLVCGIVSETAMGAAASKGTAVQQRSFASPEEAAGALVAAVRAHDRKAVVAILGPGSDQWISSGDANADRAAGEQFVSQYDAKHAISSEGNTRTLTIGTDDWPFAFPLARTGERWRFDTEAGKNEMLARRIGQNELAVINVMLAIVDAQREYASVDRNKDGLREYASKFMSSPGKQDGLYWPTAEGAPPSPLGPLVVRAASEGYKGGGKEGSGKDESKTYHGYYFRLLTGQGPHAKGGAFDYVVKGHMIGGFAALAYPARYENSGVMTFIVNHDGVVYQRDLGPETAAKARAITRFDPGPGWTETSPQ